MQIKRVEASYLANIPITPAAPLKGPTTVDLVIVEVETDDGIIGYGVTHPILAWSIAEFIKREAAPFLMGQDPMLTEYIGNQISEKFNHANSTGVISAAMSAIDIALWDIKGKALGLPVWRLLGGSHNPVPVYMTIAHREPMSLEEILEVSKYWVGQGFDRIKLAAHKADNQTQEEFVRHNFKAVKMVREAVGPDIGIRLDCNNRLTFTEALRLCKWCEPYDLTWIEDPIYHNDVRLTANLRRQTTVPVATGHNENNRYSCMQLLKHEAVDYILPHVLRVGGYTEAVKVAAMAQCFDQPIAHGGSWACHNNHLLAGMSNGWQSEFQEHDLEVYKAVYKKPWVPVKGWMTVPETPGLGLDPKPEVIKEYRVNKP